MSDAPTVLMDIARAPQKKTGRNVALVGGALLLVLVLVLVAGLDPAAPSVERATLVIDSVARGDILLADEPTGNLDSANGEAVMELLRELNRNGATICMVTHDARYAEHADRTVNLFDGKVVDHGRLAHT